MAVAYSGGLDSAVLLHLAQRYSAARDIPLFAFHVHHGLSPNADAWLAHCEAEARRLALPFASRCISVENAARSGVEEAARQARYAALGEMCREHGVSLLLTAHHQDDQAETMLLQLLRGSGVAGLSGMEALGSSPELRGPSVLLGRPLLETRRMELEAWSARAGIVHVEDESNADVRYTRNALRHGVMPRLAASFPGFQERLARTAQHMQAAQRLLDELGHADFLACADGGSLDLACVRVLSDDRIDNLFRYWLGRHGLRMPATSWLAEMRAQLLGAKDDAQVCVAHAACDVRRHRGRAYLTPKRDAATIEALPQDFCWSGEASLDFPAFHGRLHFEPAQEGLNADWLRAQTLTLRHRQGGDMVKLAPNRPSRSMKQHFQALGVPSWERPFLPLVTASRAVLYAAGVGMDCHYVQTGTGQYVRLRWEQVLYTPADMRFMPSKGRI